MLGRVDRGGDLLHAAGVTGAGQRGHADRPRERQRQAAEQRQVLLVDVDPHGQRRQVADAEQVVRGVHQLPDGDALLEDDTTQRRLDLDPRPRRRVGALRVGKRQPVRISPQRVDLFRGEAPGAERGFGLVERHPVVLHRALGLAHRALGRPVVLEQPFQSSERLLVRLELRHGVHELALLRAQVRAPHHGQHVPLVHPVPDLQRAPRRYGGRNGERGQERFRHLRQFDDRAGERRLDAGQLAAVEVERALERGQLALAVGDGRRGRLHAERRSNVRGHDDFVRAGPAELGHRVRFFLLGGRGGRGAGAAGREPRRRAPGDKNHGPNGDGPTDTSE